MTVYSRKFFIAGAFTVLAAFTVTATSISEDFSSDPLTRGWQLEGQPGLFSWNSAAGNVSVKWDSSQSNSYLAISLGATLTPADDFTAAFDLRLQEFEVTNFFQVAAGFLNLSDALAPGFRRATGYESPNLVEFAFFPDEGFYGPSLMGTMVGMDPFDWSRGGFLPDTLTTNDTFRIRMHYDGAAAALKISISKNGEPFGVIPDATLPCTSAGFQVNAFSIISYSGAGQDPSWAGSILARGTVDNVQITTTERPVGKLCGAFKGGAWEVGFYAKATHAYTLERSTDGGEWTGVDSAPGAGSRLVLKDGAPPQSNALYRVRALPR